MSGIMDTPKDLKRKNSTTDHDDRSSQSERKRKKRDGKGSTGASNRPKHFPLSERQQLALLKQMTAEEKNEKAPTPPPASKRPVGGSGRKDKVNKRNERGETPLHIATIRGELPVIMDLVKQGADVNVQDYAGWTPLHEACNHGFFDIAKFLLEAGAIVNSKGFNDDYPLHDAVLNEHTDLVALLLKHGADPLRANKKGERPLDSTDNEEIKRLMQNEVLLSDDSDSKTDDKDSDSVSSEPNKLSGASFSRELFKQFDADNFSKSSSSDSDDSDDLPLSRRRNISIQSKSSTSSNQTVDRKSSSGGYLEVKRSKMDNKRRLFSTESSESMDSESKPPKSRQLDQEPLKSVLSSEDEFFTPKPFEERYTSESKSNTERQPTAVKQTTISLSSTTGEADVYDFSPNADEFSNENNAISLKAESKATNKWESKGKQPSLFSRKSSGLFSSSKGYEFAAKKPRKTSNETIDSHTDSTTALIKPVHETSEMLFDRLFKSPQKEDSLLSAESKLKPSIFSNITSPALTTTTVTAPSIATDSLSSIAGFAGISKLETEKLFSVENSSTSSSGPTSESFGSLPSSQKSLRQSDAQSNIFSDVLEKEFNTRSLSIDNASILSRKEDSLTSVPDESASSTAKTSTRALSLDSKEKAKKTEDNKTLKSEFAENKPVKKIKTENKDKVSKTTLDSSKKAQINSTTKDIKVLTPTKKFANKSKTSQPSLSKKEAKTDKKLTLLPDSKSNFLSDLDRTSSQRQQEKLKRKKLAQKKIKPSNLPKLEEKKTAKKSEVKLMESDSWLGSVSEKIPSEKQRKAVPRSIKKLSDPVAESVPPNNPVSSDPASTKTLSNQPLQAASDLLSKSSGSASNLVEISSELIPRKTRSFSSESTGSGFRTPASTQYAEESFAPPAIPSIIHTHSSPTKIPPCDSSNVGIGDPAISKSDPTLNVSNTVGAEVTGGNDHNNAPDDENDTVNSAAPPVAVSDSLDASTDKEVDNKPNADETATIAENSIPVEKESPVEEEPSEQEKMLRLYIQERLAANKVELSHVQPLRDRIPMHVLNSRKKDPAVDKLNVIEERLAIQQRMFEKRKKIASVIPQAPQHYWEYITLTGGYLLNGSIESKLAVPVLAPPPSLCQPMVELFKAHEEKRFRLRVQHAIQREKLIISCEQEIMRVHSRAARTNQNQQTPFSACAMLMDCEVYTMPRQSNDGETGKTSIRDRFNTRMFLSWLQDVDDKYGKIKSALLIRQRHEAEALHAVQKTEWILKCQEIDRSHRALKPEEINEIYVPKVNNADDFELLPA